MMVFVPVSGRSWERYEFVSDSMIDLGGVGVELIFICIQQVYLVVTIGLLEPFLATEREGEGGGLRNGETCSR